MSLEPPTLAALQLAAKQEIFAETSQEAALRRGTVESAIGNAIGITIYGIYQFAMRLANAFLTYLAARRWAAFLNMTRLPARKSAGLVDFTGTNGFVAEVDDVLVHAATGNRYLVTEETTIAGGVASVPVEAEEAGEDGDLAAGVTLTWESVPVGYATSGTVGVDGIVDGTDAEDDEALWARISAKIQDKSPGGSVADYERWAKEVAGVSRVKAFPNYDGPGSVLVVITNDSGVSPVPGPTLVAGVQTYIDDPSRVPATGVAMAFACTKTDVTVAITLLPVTKPVSAARKTAVEAQILDLFSRRRGFGATIVPDDIRTAILAELLISEFTMTSPTTIITADAIGVLHLAAINWTGP